MFTNFLSLSIHVGKMEVWLD